MIIFALQAVIFLMNYPIKKTILMIPVNKKAAVEKAIQSAFSVTNIESIAALTKGLSSALVFKIVVQGKPYLLRVITRTDAQGDPSFYYGCMKTAAEQGIAPAIHYMDINDRVSITDFITEQPFSINAARQKLPQLLRSLHALPKFPFRTNYFERMEALLPNLATAGIFPADELKELYNLHQRIINVYPINDTSTWVSCHNDCKIENIVFDGIRPWLVDWESAFLNDPYVDLAIVANFVVSTEADENTYLETYFEECIDEYRQARFYLLQQVLHFYYFVLFMLFDNGPKPIDTAAIKTQDFTSFHKSIWKGEIHLSDSRLKREYAMIHLKEFIRKAGSDRCKEALKLMRYHHCQ